VRTSFYLFLFLIFSIEVMSQHKCRINLRDREFKYIEGAKVFIDGVRANYHSLNKYYYTDSLQKKESVIEITHPEYEPIIYASFKWGDSNIYMLKKGDAFVYVNDIIYPYYPYPKLIFVTLRGREFQQEASFAEGKSELVSLLDSLNLEIHFSYYEDNQKKLGTQRRGYKAYIGKYANTFIVKKKDSSDIEHSNSIALKGLRESTIVLYAGPLVTRTSSYQGGKTFTNRMMVWFRDTISDEDAKQALSRVGLTIYYKPSRIEAPWGGPYWQKGVIGYHVYADPGEGRGMNDIVEELQKSRYVLSAYPQLTGFTLED